MKSISDMFKRILESKLKDRKIAWSRKQGGLELALFGRPIILFENSGGISLGLISGTDSQGSRKYDYLHFAIGSLEDPNTNPEESIEKVLSALDGIRSLMDTASNTAQVEVMKLTKINPSSGKAYLKRWAKSKNLDNVNVRHNRGSYRLEWLPPSKQFPYLISINSIHKNGSGDLLIVDKHFDNGKWKPLDDFLEHHYAAQLERD